MDSLLRDQMLSEACSGLQAGKEEEELPHIYSILRRSLKDGRLKFGLYPTPLLLARFMVKIAKPEPGEIIYDPACGLCSFFIESHRYLKALNGKEVGAIFLGYDINPRLLQIGKAWMESNGLDASRIQERALHLKGYFTPSLFENGGDDSDKFERRFLILTHPPYEKITTRQHIPVEYHDREFLRHCMERTRNSREGRCGIIVSQNLLVNPRRDDVFLRKKLVNEFNIQLIIRLPKRAFSNPGEEVNYHSYILYFDNRGKTNRIVRCNLLEDETRIPSHGLQSTDGASFAEAEDIWGRWKQQSIERPFAMTKAEQKYAWIVDANELCGKDPACRLIDDEPAQQEEKEPVSLEELIQQLDAQSAELQEVVRQLQRSVQEGL